MCHECIKEIGEKIKMEVRDKIVFQFAVGGISRISKLSSALDPGQGVTVVDSLDPNYRRDGFVRDSTPGPYHQSLDTNEYNVWFEPGEQDYQYRGTQIEPNGQHSTNIPKRKEP